MSKHWQLIFFAEGDDAYDSAYRSIVGRRVSRVEKKKSGIDCPARTLKEEELHAAVDNAIRDEQTEAIAEYSESLARRLIEKVTVYDEKLMVELKSGLQIDVEA